MRPFRNTPHLLSCDQLVDFDPKLEAAELLELAVSTYFQQFTRTDLPYLPCFENFDKKRRSVNAADES